MGMIIKAASKSKSRGSCTGVELSVEAAEQCIAKAGINKRDVDLLIHIGVYRDDNIVEPAMATLVQHALGLNLDPIEDSGQKKTFSFDLMNGACGFLYAAHVTDCLLRSGERRLGLVVSADVHPSTEQNEGFPYTHTGAAVLLERSEDEEKGFRHFFFEASDGGCCGTYGYCDVDAHGREGRKNVTVEVRDNFSRRLRTLATETITNYVRQGWIHPSELKHIITSQPCRGFARRVTESLGFDGNHLIDIHDEYGDPHTSALSIGYCVARDKGLLEENDQILFVGAGSGLTVACGLYVV
jgi:3-oxoacyl-[acyl-carrier-protein] synthase-3